jgi:SAM-dependent methyltransferase
MCGCKRFRCRYALDAYTVVECSECRFAYNGNFVGGGEDDGLFSRDYFLVEHEQAFAGHVQDYRQDPSLPVFEQRLKEIETLIPVGRVLDVGPGLGTFLRLAKERGWSARGLDISRFGARHIQDTHHIEVTVGHLRDAPLAPASFDLIAFWDSIEHVAYPKEDLERAFELLRPGGVLLLTTDNFDCLVADLAGLIYRSTAGVSRYPVQRVFIDKNYSYFTEATLLRLVSDVGFVDSQVTKMEYPIDKIRLSGIERLALSSIYRIARLTNRQAQLTLIARKPGA